MPRPGAALGTTGGVERWLFPCQAAPTSHLGYSHLALPAFESGFTGFRDCRLPALNNPEKPRSGSHKPFGPQASGFTGFQSAVCLKPQKSFATAPTSHLDHSHLALNRSKAAQQLRFIRGATSLPCLFVRNVPLFVVTSLSRRHVMHDGNAPTRLR